MRQVDGQSVCCSVVASDGLEAHALRLGGALAIAGMQKRQGLVLGCSDGGCDQAVHSARDADDG